MPVQNIECQIAQTQIARLLSNEPLNKEVLADLESHVAKCSECQTYIMTRRATLESMVTDSALRTEKPTVRKPSSTPKYQKLFAPLAPKAAVRSTRETPPREVTEDAPTPEKGSVKEKRATAQTTTASTFWKPLAYSGALALVLFGMSYLLKNPTALFGEKAMASVPSSNSKDPSSESKKTVDQKSSDTTSLTATQDTTEDRPTVFANGDDPKLEPQETPALVASTPPDATESDIVAPLRPTPAKPIAAAPKAKLQKKFVRKHRPRFKKRHTGSIRFYNSSGEPIN